MDDISKIAAVLYIVPALQTLNEGRGEFNHQEFNGCLDTEIENVQEWWDSLDWLGKIDVGSVALHYGKMTPNYKWACGDRDRRRKQSKFETLSKSQKKIVQFCFSKRKAKFNAFELSALLKL